MKSRTVAPIALAVALGIVGPDIAKSDKPGADWMPTEQVKQMLIDAGYSSITELEAVDGQWEGECMNNVTEMEFHVDPKTGAITRGKPTMD